LYLSIFILLLGGLALFLMGMQHLSSSVRKLAGNHIREMLNSFTKNKVVALVFGIIFTVLFQSSSAASVVIVGFVDAGLIVFSQTLPILLGTGIGTTITAQIISFKIGHFALLAVALGFFVGTFGQRKMQPWGYLVMGLGLLFYGMQLMSESMIPLRDNAVVKQWLESANNPFLGLLVGLLVTAIIQSSAAFIGLLITLLTSHLLNFDQCLPMIIGANIGTTVTALVSSINASHKAIKVALVNTLFRVLAGVVFLMILPFWKESTWVITSEGEGARAIANAHTLFNLGMVILMFPLIGLIARKFEKLQFKRKVNPTVQLKYLNSDAVAVAGVITPILRKELLEMGQLVAEMLKHCMEPFFNRSMEAVDKIRDMEEKVDTYREEINQFLVRSHRDITIDSWSDEAFRQLHIMNELEQVADIISVSIMHHGEEWLKKDIEFSELGKAELASYHEKSMKQLNRALSLIEHNDFSKAHHLKLKYRKYAYMAFDLEMHHYKRLFVDKTTSPESGKVHMELINHLRMINSRATNFGRIILLDEELSRDVSSDSITE